MFTTIISTILLTVSTNSCSIAYPQDGTVYISNVQLLPEVEYPNSVLLTMQRTQSYAFPIAFNTRPRLNYVSNGPWCKIMNVNDGTVSDVVTCSDYTRNIREFATADTDPKATSVTCTDNCDGATATCNILRNGIIYTLDNIAYLGSSTNCGASVSPVVYFGSMSTSFTINDISTTYISFSTNMVGIEFDDTVSPVTYKTYDVERQGDWGYLKPGQYGLDMTPSIYSAANVIRVALPCCLCYGSTLRLYSIVTDRTQMTQIFTMKSLGFGGGNVDVIKQRVFNSGLYFTQRITVYDLANEGVANTLNPNLCDMLVYCFMAPCHQSGLRCPYNTNARCVNDYCGGCNARWFCGASDVTNFCDSGQTSNQICPSQTSIGKITVL